MKLLALKKKLSPEFEALNKSILRSLHSDAPLIEEIGNYLIKNGGKRIRPMLHLIMSNALNAPKDASIQLATVIEFIHTATLLHDDVVDSSGLRRGKLTANRVWNNASAVLVGDFIYSRAFQLMVSLGLPEVMKIMADTTNTIAEGEVYQLELKGNINLSEPEYFKIIECKTAKLFEAACRLSAVISHQDEETKRALSHFGLNLGIAFQIIDDSLDYQANNKFWGKNIGDDLREGKITLPLLHALTHCSATTRDELHQIIQNLDTSKFSKILEVIEDTKSIEYTYTVAKSKMDIALSELEVLPDGEYKELLKDIAFFAVNRSL